MIHRSPFPDVEIPIRPLHEHVFTQADRWPDKPALIDGPTGRTLTYARLRGAARAVAAGLAARGFGRGDVFAIYSPNVPEYAAAFFGVSTAGGVVTTMNPLYTAGEVNRQLRDSGARFLLTIPQFLDAATRGAEGTGVEEVFVFGEAAGATPFAALMATGEPPAVAIDPREDLAALPYSSGTTGMPKGVMLTHYNLVANLAQIEAVEGIDAADTLIGILPFYHIYGMTVIMSAALQAGATIVTMPRFDLEQFLGLLQQHRVTTAYLVPPIVLALAKHPLVDQYDISALKNVMSGAAPLPESVARGAAARNDMLVRQGYGLTETSPVTHTNPRSRELRNHVGRHLPAQHRVARRGRGDRNRRRRRPARRGVGAGAAGDEGLPQQPRGHPRDDRRRGLAAHRRHRQGRRRRLSLRRRPAQGADQVQGVAGGAGGAGGCGPVAPGGRRRGRHSEPRRGGRRGAEGVRRAAGRGRPPPPRRS